MSPPAVITYSMGDAQSLFLFPSPQHHRRACGDVELEPAFLLFVVEVVVHGEVLDRVIRQPEAAVCLVVGVEHHGVFALLDQEAIVLKRPRGVEVEDEHQRAALVGEDLVAVVVPYLCHRSPLERPHRLDHLKHRFVEVAKVVIAEVVVVNEVPLAAGVLVRPAVALTREVYPLGMAKLVAHEVEIAAVDGRDGQQLDHLVESNAAIDGEIAVTLGHVPIHVGIDEAEDDCLVAYECLVVALDVGDGLLILAAVGDFPEEG